MLNSAEETFLETIWTREYQVNLNIYLFTSLFIQLEYQVHKVDKDTLLVSLLEQVNRESGDSESIIDFVMCNPPFYSNEQDLEGRSEQIRKPEKRPKAKSVNTARTHESIYDEGGEVGFIKTMIDESIILATRVRFSYFPYSIEINI